MAPAVTEETIVEALRQVMDPELGRDLVDLGMIREVQVADGRVQVTLALTTMACPLRNRLAEDARAAVAALPGVAEVRVEMAQMTAEERARAFGQPPSPALAMSRIQQVVAVMSGKGGVGKSLVTALLAVELARQGYRVSILDADVTGPSIPRLFGLDTQPRGSPMGLLPVHSRLGIGVMSTNLLLQEEDTAVIWRGPLITRMIQQFWTDVIWGRLDYLLVDLPPGTSDATLTVMQSLPLNGVVLVTTPQGLAAMVVRKGLHMTGQMGVPILGVVENMSYFICPDTGGRHELFGPGHSEELARVAGAPLLARLPVDPQISRLCDEGRIEEFTSEATVALAQAFVRAKPIAAAAAGAMH